MDPSLPATPRMGLRERKKPVLPATAPPSTVKKRQQRVATPRSRKSMTAVDAFVQDSDAPPLPTPFDRDVSPGTGLSELMHNMNISINKAEPSNPASKPTSAHGTPTPIRNGFSEESTL